VTLTDIGKTLADGKTSLKIKDIMTRDIISVDGNLPLYEVVKVFNKEKSGKTDGQSQWRTHRNYFKNRHTYQTCSILKGIICTVCSL